MYNFDRSLLVHAAHAEPNNARSVPWVVRVHVVFGVFFFRIIVLIERTVHVVVPFEVVVFDGTDVADVGFFFGFTFFFLVSIAVFCVVSFRVGIVLRVFRITAFRLLVIFGRGALIFRLLVIIFCS